MSYQVDKGVEIPERAPNGKYPWNTMQVGDSFVLDQYDDPRKVRGAAKQRTKRSGERFTVRRDHAGEYRCWRVA